MYNLNGMTVLEGSDFRMDYCKMHNLYYKGPSCRKCEKEVVEFLAIAEKADERPKLWS